MERTCVTLSLAPHFLIWILAKKPNVKTITTNQTYLLCKNHWILKLIISRLIDIEIFWKTFTQNWCSKCSPSTLLVYFDGCAKTLEENFQILHFLRTLPRCKIACCANANCLLNDIFLVQSLTCSRCQNNAYFAKTINQLSTWPIYLHAGLIYSKFGNLGDTWLIKYAYGEGGTLWCGLD